MVEVGSDIVLVALENLLGKLLFLSLGVGLVAKAVALLVGLGTEVDAILVAQVVPDGGVGIVAGAHSIDVEALHHLQVLNHALLGDDVSAVGIHLMTVGTLDEDGLAVDQQLGVFDFHLAEAHLQGNDLAQGGHVLALHAALHLARLGLFPYLGQQGI